MDELNGNEHELQAQKYMDGTEIEVQKYKKISVPTQYREGAKILKQIVEEGKSLKELVYNNKHIVGFIVIKFLSLLIKSHCRKREVQ